MRRRQWELKTQEMAQNFLKRDQMSQTSLGMSQRKLCPNQMMFKEK
jgi:hypothetical protein